MALQYQTSFFPFNSGLNNKIDTLVLEPPYLLECENAVFLKQGSIQKRYGYEKIADAPAEIIQINDINDRLYAQSGVNIYLFSAVENSFYDMGAKLQNQLQHYEIARKNYQHKNCSGLATSDYSVITWENNQDGYSVKYSVIDNDGTPIVSDVLVENGAVWPKLVETSNYVWVVYKVQTNGEIKARRIPKDNPSTLQVAQILVDDAYIGSTQLYDCNSVLELNAITVAWDAYAGGIYCKYIDDTGTEGLGIALNGLPTSAQVTGVAPTGGSYDPVLHIHTGVTSASATYHLITYTSAGKIYGALSDFNFTPLTTDFKIDDSTVCENTAGAWDGTKFAILVEKGNYTFPLDNLISKYIINTAGTITTTVANYVLGCRVWSDCSFLSDGSFIFWGLAESDTQPTFFLYKDTGASVPILIGKHLPGTAGERNDGGYVGSNSLCCAVLQRNQFSTDDGKVFTNNGVSLVNFTEATNERQVLTGIGRVGVLAGTLPQLIDGRNCLPIGFQMYPEISFNSETTGGSLTTTGTYSWTLTYSWTDNNGDVHESAPAVPVTYTLTGSNNAAVLNYTRYHFSNWNLDTFANDIIINLYRTLNGGVVYYKSNSSSANFVYNDVDGVTVTITDTASDSTISGNPQLYSNDGTLDNIAPPYCTLVANYNNRIFLAGIPEKPNEVRFSQTYVPGVGLQFNELLSFTVKDGEGGPITALASLDSALIIFKRKNIYYISGIGPDSTGLQSDFNPQEIATDVGCIYPESIILTPAGLIFKSQKGIYQLDRQFQISYVGQQVENYNDSEIYQASIMPEQNHIRFVLSTGEVLYYNYIYGIWSVFTGYYASSGCCYQQDGVFYHSNSTGEIFKSTTGYTDAGSSYKFKLKTAWIDFGNKLSLKRIKKAALLGERIEDHKMIWKIYHDYRAYPTEILRFDVTNGETLYGQNPQWGNSSYYGTNNNEFGDDYKFGSNSFYGGSNDGTMIYSHQIKQQKSLAIAFELYDDNFSTTTGPGFNLVGFEIEFAWKNSMKFKQAKRI